MPPSKAADTQASPEARGEATVSIVSRSGAYWPGVVAPEPALLLAPCLTGPDALRPRVAGYVVYSLVFFPVAPPKLVALEKAPSVSDPLVTCIAHALEGMRMAVSGLQVGGELLAYVSLR